MTTTKDVCSKTHREKVTAWSKASLTNGVQPLQVHEEIEGVLSVPDTTMGAEFASLRQIS